MSLHSFNVCFELLNLRFSIVRISDSWQQTEAYRLTVAIAIAIGQLAIAGKETTSDPVAAVFTVVN